MTNPNPGITGNEIIDRQAGGDRDQANTGEERTFKTDPPDSRPDLEMGDNTDTGGAVDDSTFHTSTVEANRSLEQGNGVGARELQAQADPTEAYDSQGDLDARADTTRDNHQTPRGNDAVRDTADNLGGGR